MDVPWSQVQASVPCYVLNMDRCAERWTLSEACIKEAGFRNVQRVSAFDKDTHDLASEWAKLGSPPLRDKDNFVTNKGKQAVAIGQYNIWKRIIDEDIPFAVVFEDDVFFHKRWKELSEQMWTNTPKDFDICFMGSSFDVDTKSAIIKAPVYCLHAYIITKEGAKKCLDVCLRDADGTWTIDSMLRAAMFQSVCPFNWYVWNGLAWLDTAAFSSPMWQHNIKNKGLVFQDWTLGSDIDPALDIRNKRI